MKVEIIFYGETLGSCLEFLGRVIKCPEREYQFYQCSGAREQLEIMDSMRDLKEKLNLDIELVAHSDNSTSYVKARSLHPVRLQYPNGNHKRAKLS